jgi:hypothetical protein
LKHRIALCAGLAALGMSTVASAQIYVAPPRIHIEPPVIEPMFESGLAPQEILMIVRASGLRPLTQPARRGRRYLILASDNMGGQLRVVVNAYSGRIVDASPAYDPRFASHPVRPRGLVPVPPEHVPSAPRTAAAAPAEPPADLRVPSPPPPRVARATPPQAPAPSAPAATGHDHRLAGGSEGDTNAAAPARPERTPLPRPRPRIAASETTATAAPPAAAAPAAPQATVQETSPEAETPAAKPAPAAPSAAPAQPPAETQMVPVAPLD